MLGKAATILCLALSGCAANHELQIGWDRTGNDLVEIGGQRLKVDLKYLTSDNIAGMPLYPEGFRAQLRPEAAQSLNSAAKELNRKGYKLVVLDAWRPPVSSALLSHLAYKHGIKNLVATPELSGHCKGVSVDVTLERLDGSPACMPGKYDDFSDWTHTDASRLLNSSMRAAGFSGHRKEWWHFDHKTKPSAQEIEGPKSFKGWKYLDGKLIKSSPKGKN